MRVMGLDIGERRIGVAVSDPAGRVATPLTVVAASDRRMLASIVEEYDVEAIVVGIPLAMDGSEGAQAARVRPVAESLARELRLPVRYFDERLTSAQARRVMGEAGVPDRKKRGRLDMLAATVLLQAYLDSGSRDD